MFVFDFELLIYEYLLVCGYEYLCNDTYIPGAGIRPTTNFRDTIKNCPECFCDTQCMSRGDCCPDMFFKLPEVTCHDVTIAESDVSKLPHAHYPVIGICPQNASNRISEQCSDDLKAVSMINLPPLTSLSSSLTYKNEHCAICHGEHQFEKWIHGTRCEHFQDFNFVSSVPELLNLLNISGCLLEFNPGNLDVRECKMHNDSRTNQHLLNNTNNETDSTHQNEFQISTACSSAYELNFKGYRNVFCYMMFGNHLPGSENHTSVSTCLNNGMEQLDTNLELACLFHNKSQTTMPYKNIFCYYCNLWNSSHRYNDASFHVEEKIDDVSFRYLINNMYIISNIVFHDHYIMNQLQTVNITDRVGNRYHGADIVMYNGAEINMTNLIMQKMALFPEDNTCQTNVRLPNATYRQYTTGSKNCSCNPACLFSPFEQNCCLDTTLLYQSACLDDTSFMHHYHSIPIANACWKKNQYNAPDAESTLCEHTDDDLLLKLPVFGATTSTEERITYKNIFCYLCSDFETNNVYRINDNMYEYLDTGNTASYETMTVRMSCHHPVEYHHHVSLSDVLNTFHKEGCNATILQNVDKHVKLIEPPCNPPFVGPGGRSDQSCTLPIEYPDCTSKDPGVNLACKSFGFQFNMVDIYEIMYKYLGPMLYEIIDVEGPYENVFCYMCTRPPHIVIDETDQVISKCNVTGTWATFDAVLEEACQLFPEVHAMYPYKNAFCKECNGVVDLLGVLNSKRDKYTCPCLLGCSQINIDEQGIHHITSFRNIFSLQTYIPSEGKRSEDCQFDQIYDSTLVSIYIYI